MQAATTKLNKLVYLVYMSDFNIYIFQYSCLNV